MSEEAATFGCSIIHKESPQQVLHTFYLDVFTPAPPPKDFVSAPRIKLAITALWNHLHIQCLKSCNYCDRCMTKTNIPAWDNQSVQRRKGYVWHQLCL